MSKVKNKDTNIERMLGRALWGKGLRYRKNDSSILGKPDFAFKKYKVVVFVDGEFWHGKDWDVKKHDHKTNVEFWHTKIEKNIERDKFVNRKLKEEGWVVLRFWGNEVKKNLLSCVEQVEVVINEAGKNSGN